ncbi:MAG: NAD(P)/FAD-dependent oxidoreductase [Gammaproteobacteria bacterium]|nr:MAG: NAD(P)/FAD-dependent oxidoreductase [Gammaproteobacteria bacterium]
MSASEEAGALDVVVVGAGFAGMYAIWKLRQSGLSLRVIEAGSDVGGTWYWNRYPGARCDITSMEYSFSFSEDLQQEWEWTEIMAAQPEILHYANHVADRFDLREHIDFDTRVTEAVYLEDENLWQVTTDRGSQYRARFCIMATGCLSVPNTPEIEGQDTFAGEVYHTGNWPSEGVDFSGKTVAIIGTGSSGVQSIPVIAREAKHLTVLQRTPNYNLPANNAPLPDDYRDRIKSHYPEVRAAQRLAQIGVSEFSRGLGGLGSYPEPTEAILETTAEERAEALDHYGFEAIRHYNDLALSEEANELACDMYREQVRRMVDDPKTAEGLMPRDYPFGCKRPVIDIGYYETFNRDNVTLVDLRQGGIERITPTGVQTAQGAFDFDVLVYATGFDAMTGALLRVDIRGRHGVSLASHWAHGPKTYLGLQMTGFPNFFTVTGPGSPSVLSNMLVSIEQHVDWISDCINYLDQRGARTIEPTPEAEDAWVRHVFEVADGTMLTAESCNSWYLGANIPGKPRIFMPYVAGVGAYRQVCDGVVADG